MDRKYVIIALAIVVSAAAYYFFVYNKPKMLRKVRSRVRAEPVAAVIEPVAAVVTPVVNWVRGFYGGDYADNLMTTDNTLETCRTWAESKNYPQFGFRNYNGTCWGFNNVHATQDSGDLTHSSACTNAKLDITKGCV